MSARTLDVWAILCHPADVRNVGGAIRAVANHGWAGLRIVTNTDFDERDIHCYSSGAIEFVPVEFVPSLDEALADCQLVVGTSRRMRDPDAPPQWPSAGLAGRLSQDIRTAILFGTERTGLTRAQLDLCSAMVHMPTLERFPSMNLAHSVACLGYELARPNPESLGPATKEAPPILSASAREAFFTSVLDALTRLSYPPGRSPQAFVSRLRRILHRANLNHQELSMLGGIFGEMLRLGRLAGVAGQGDGEPLEGEQTKGNDDQAKDNTVEKGLR